MEQSIETIYKRLAIKQKELRDLKKMIRDELDQNPRFRELQEEMKSLRDERKGIQMEVEAISQTEMDQIDDLKLEIDTDKELLADIALNLYVSQETVEILDEYDQRWVPRFSVKFYKD
jgi:hypothetical protein